jgi:DNA modification methylase
MLNQHQKPENHIFLLSKSEDYFYDHEAIKEPAAYGSKGSHFDTGKTAEHQLGRASRKPRKSKVRGEFSGKTNDLPGREAFRAITEMRNKRSVWTVSTQPYAGAHFAVFPPELIKPCILAGCPRWGVVLDPFGGSGTTGAVALELGRSAVLCELNPDYIRLIRQRCEKSRPHWAEPIPQDNPLMDLPLFEIA